MSPQIFLTLKFVVWAKQRMMMFCYNQFIFRKIIEIVVT